jgi:hypothetical protein
VEDRQVGWSSRMRLDLRKELGVHSSADALSGRVETGSEKIARDWRRETVTGPSERNHD